MRIKLDPGAYLPERAHEMDGGLDLRAPVAAVVPARGSAVIDTGVHVELPLGTAGLLVSKSGLNVRHDITSEGLIDAGYSGSIVVKLYNNGDTPYYIDRGDKISQLVVIPVCLLKLEIVTELDETARGAKGFGSTGK